MQLESQSGNAKTKFQLNEMMRNLDITDCLNCQTGEVMSDL